MDEDAGGGDAQPLVLANVDGVFIVLAAGSGLAVFCAFVEIIFDVWITAHRVKVPLRDELIAEVKFIFSFSGDVKPVQHRESTGSSSKSSKGSKRDDEAQDTRDEESHRDDDDRRNLAPTPHSDTSSIRTTHAIADDRAMSYKWLGCENTVDSFRIRQISAPPWATRNRHNPYVMRHINFAPLLCMRVLHTFNFGKN